MRSIKELIKRRRLQLLIHSYIYYELNDNIVSDATWSKWAMELVKLQVSMAADKTKGINYVKSTSGKNAQKLSKELKDGKKL